MASSDQRYIPQGVVITPANFSVGDKIRICYDGILSKSGASDISVRLGYGSKWNIASDVKMVKTPTGFETTLSVSSSEPLNLCFKDGMGNWDNNSGRNYVFDVV